MEGGVEGRDWSLFAAERWLRMENRGQVRETPTVGKGRVHQDAGRGLGGRNGAEEGRGTR